MTDESNIRIFAKQLEEFRVKTHERLDLAKQDLARKTLAKLVARSPVLTGQYILSHKVGINEPDLSYEHTLPTLKLRKNISKGKQIGTNIGVNRRSVEMKAKSVGQQKIMQAGYKDTIYISNSVPHAVNVEYLGWAKKPALHVYGLTKAEMRLQAQAIVKAFENKKL